MPMGMMGGPAFGMMPFEERYHALPVAAAEKSDTSKLEVRLVDIQIEDLCRFIHTYFLGRPVEKFCFHRLVSIALILFQLRYSMSPSEFVCCLQRCTSCHSWK